MTLAETAALLGASPKWVLNAVTALGVRKRYTLSFAQRLAVARAISEATGMPLARAYGLAERALTADKGRGAPMTIPIDEGAVMLVIDLERILSAFNVRLSGLRTTFEPRKRGRPPARGRDPIETASDWGIDVTLLTDNRRKTVTERVRQLDSMARFAREVARPKTRRVKDHSGSEN